MAEWTKQGVGTAALTTGIIGTVGTALNWIAGNGCGNSLLAPRCNSNCNSNCSENNFVNRYELNMAQTISAKDQEIALLKADKYTDQKFVEVVTYFNNKMEAMQAGFNQKIEGLQSQVSQQAVYNASNNGVVSCLQAQIEQLNSLTKVIIPIGNVCPAPMPQYNSWTAPTAPAGTAAA